MRIVRNICIGFFFRNNISFSFQEKVIFSLNYDDILNGVVVFFQEKVNYYFRFKYLRGISYEEMAEDNEFNHERFAS